MITQKYFKLFRFHIRFAYVLLDLIGATLAEAVYNVELTLFILLGFLFTISIFVILVIAKIKS